MKTAINPRFLAAGLILSLGVVLSAAAAEAQRPNFVVLMAEAQGWAQTSVQMDDQVPASRSRTFNTPALERLAKSGMRFTYGYALSPRCTPSRAALFTGRGPAALRMTYVGAGRDGGPVRTALIPPEPLLEMPTSEVTVAELLRDVGYATAHFGKWHVGRSDPSRHGFDASDGATSNGGPDNVASPNPKQAYGMTERGLAFMAKAKAEGRPFYVQMSHYPNQERKERARPGRDSAVADADEIDKTFGLVLDGIARLGLTGTTYIFYTADHGGQGRTGNAPLSGGKGSVLEGGLRVPFLVSGPGIPGNVCSRVPATACDILPTIAELAGSRSPLAAGVEGGSLVPVLRDPAGRGVVRRPREELVFHFPHYDLGNGGPATAILLGGFKLIRNYETRTVRMFELEKDPGESRDLAATMPAKAAELEARLNEYLKAVGAQMARANPDYDPSKAPDPSERREGDERRGGKGGGKGGGGKKR